MPAFHEVQFMPSISYGSRGGPKRVTQVVTLKSGFEQRNTSWLHSRRMYNAGMGLRKMGDLYDVIQFWEARRGRLYGFRWKDWADYRSNMQAQATSHQDVLLDVGNGVKTQFQLVKRYTSGGEEYVRPIVKPVAGTVKVALNTTQQLSGWTVNTTTGIITFTVAPGNGVQVKAGFEFDVPVRFDAEELEISLDAFEAGAVPDIKVIEIRV